MDATAFRALLAEGPLLADGGMGTSLIARGVPVDASKAAKAIEIAETRYCAVAATIRSVVRLTHEVAIAPNE